MPWEPAWSRLIATSGDASIWLADLDAADAGESALAILSEDERVRADRFVFDIHRRRFIACRAWLRTRLAERLGRPPASLRFEYGPVGKPSLFGGEPLRFNVSHSDRHALVAMAEGAEIGVDIERLRPLSDMDALAARVFSTAEQAALGRVPADRRIDAFFAGWTRKEAYIKARGEGIGFLGAIEVALSPGETPRLIRVAGQPEELQRWSLEAFTPVPGCAAAVCLEGPGRHWNAL
ncbi:MAG TPA: 4'-phosphopantetheinyl transferase superfamily protein [Vicinamibacterales bacterium]|nr:4'-phosphopantetheinyl transferase superfamily protein [Vicinamibacterales bacterium]